MTQLVEFEELKAWKKYNSMLLNSISHELRTPLNAILNQSIKLQKNNKEDESQRPITIIHSSAILLMNLTNDIIDM